MINYPYFKDAVLQSLQISAKVLTVFKNKHHLPIYQFNGKYTNSDKLSIRQHKICVQFNGKQVRESRQENEFRLTRLRIIAHNKPNTKRTSNKTRSIPFNIVKSHYKHSYNNNKLNSNIMSVSL